MCAIEKEHGKNLKRVRSGPSNLGASIRGVVNSICDAGSALPESMPQQLQVSRLLTSLTGRNFELHQPIPERYDFKPYSMLTFKSLAKVK